MFYSFYYFTKIMRTSCSFPEIWAVWGSLYFLPSPPAVAAPVLTCASFIRTREAPEFGRHPTQVLTNKADTTNSRSHGRCHFTSTGVWPGELFPCSGWFRISMESRWYSDLKSPLSKRKPRWFALTPKKYKVPKMWLFKLREGRQ